MDLPGAAERFASFKAALVDRGIDPANIFEISSLTHRGVMPLMHKTATVLKTAPQFEPKQEPVQSTEYKYTPEPAFKMANLDHEDGVMRFARQLRSMGVDDALREAGAQSGDLVAIDDFTFEFVE